MLFTPKSYPSIETMQDEAIMGAQSDTIINEQEVFGYVNNIAYAASYIYDEPSEAYYSIASDIVIK